MDESDYFILNIVLPEEVSEQIQEQEIDGFKIEEVLPAEEQQTAHFGIIEITTVIAIVTGISNLVKTCLEIRKLLKEQEQKTGKPNLAAKLSTPDGRVELTIETNMKEEEIVKVVKELFA
jgi:hypothetical protein